MAKVTDGDTLRLEDGRAVRLIGINAPELAHDHKPAEPLAERAREALKTLLEGEAEVGLTYGRERHDRYQRLLAHVYLKNGLSVQARLLEMGLAAQIVVPPNLGQLRCYRAAERRARKANRGVWQGIYRPLPIATLARDTRGFKLVGGRVSRIGKRKHSVWLNLADPADEDAREVLAVRIARQDLSWFNTWRPQSLLHKNVVVRGWVSTYRGQMLIRLRHPASLEILP